MRVRIALSRVRKRSRGSTGVRAPFAKCTASKSPRWLTTMPRTAPCAGRRFGEEGDVATVAALVQRSDGVRRTKELATSHAQQAAAALGVLAPSASRDALLRLCFDVLNRKA